jgi:guanylate kinase
VREFPAEFGVAVQHTSRLIQPGEREGVDFHFSSTDVVRSMGVDGDFVVQSSSGGDLYGASKPS